jgi:hypothetical protein
MVADEELDDSSEVCSTACTSAAQLHGISRNAVTLALKRKRA